MTFTHLTDEQLAGHLAGQSSPGSDDHLAACAACRAEIDSMRASLRVFNQASLEWAETQPRVHRPAPSWRPAMVWAALCVAVLSVVILAGLLRRPQQVKMAVISNGDNNTAELKQDNELLSAIDKELDSTQLSPEKMYGTTDSLKAQ
jgi:predicted anti-sigma-YlaC factor YlaD